MITAKNVIEAAATELKENGWTQGTYRSGIGAHCAVGAIQDAVQRAPAYFDYGVGFDSLIRARLAAVRRIARAIGGRKTTGLEYADLHDIIVDWNDDPERTREEVLAVFEKAASL